MRCLVIGGADCVWKDIQQALDLSEFDGVVAAKRIGECFNGKLVAWATLHPGTMPDSIRIRRANNYPDADSTWSNKAVFNFKPTNLLPDWAGSSGLYAVRVALELGYRRIVCAGIPMDSSPHFNHSEDWNSAAHYHKGWIRHKSEVAPYVRSVSGWTKALLGAPTKEWLNGSDR